MKLSLRLSGVLAMNTGMPSTSRGAASPMARLMARMAPVRMLGIAAGKVIFEANLTGHPQEAKV